jgi:hypothetical protein
VMAQLIKSTCCEPGEKHGLPIAASVMRPARATAHQGPRSTLDLNTQDRIHECNQFSARIEWGPLQPGTGPYMFLN